MMTYYRLILCLLIFLKLNTIWAQVREKPATRAIGSSGYQTEAILLRYSTFLKNGEVYPIGVTGQGLKPFLVENPEAMKYFHTYQNQRRWSLVVAGLQIATQVIAFSTNDKSVKSGFHIGGALISIASIPLFIGSYNNLNKAVWIRNGEFCP